MGIRSSRALLPRIEVGSRTMKGKRPTNEDTVLIEFDPMANEALFGVFDGHNGAECAQYLQSHYPGVLRAQEDFVDGSSGQVEEALKRAAAAVDATYLKQAKREQWQAGSTATLAYWRDGEVWFSQTGDSRAIIVKDGEATKITNVHAIENPDELARYVIARHIFMQIERSFI